MTISYKKVNSMIDAEVEQQSDMSDQQKQVLKELCEKIYMIESSVEASSNQQLIADVKGQITLRSNEM